MRSLKKSIEIEAPAERAYAFLTHPTNLPKIWPSLIEVSDVEHRPDGAHAFNYKYKMAGIPFHGRSRTTHVEPNKVVISKSEGGIDSTFRWTYAPTKRGGVNLTCSIEYTIPTPLIGKIAESVVAKINEHELDVLLANAKVAIEAAATAHAPLEASAPPAAE